MRRYRAHYDVTITSIPTLKYPPGPKLAPIRVFVGFQYLRHSMIMSNVELKIYFLKQIPRHHIIILYHSLNHFTACGGNN